MFDVLYVAPWWVWVLFIVFIAGLVWFWRRTRNKG